MKVGKPHFLVVSTNFLSGYFIKHLLALCSN